MPLFVLDTNFFIQAHRAYYPLDIADSFWNLVKQLAVEGKVISVDKVRDEIFINDDPLKQWIEKNLSDSFFKTTNKDTIINEYSEIAAWAESRADHYKRAAVDEFLEYEKADAWLVSYCKAEDEVLVTQEIGNPDRKNRIMIPDVCEAFDVKYTNMMEMFRELRVRF